jgi:2-dehydropantoate 2-reductase
MHGKGLDMDLSRILIEGIGSIGGVIAGKLIQAGYAPTLVTGNEKISVVINRNGISVSSPDEKFTVRSRAFTSLAELDQNGRYDVVLLVMKAHQVVEAARSTLPFLDPEHGFVLTCQNGIVQDAVAAEVGAGRVAAGIIGWGGTMHGPGVYERTGPGAIHIGEPDGSRTERIEKLAGILRAVTPVEVSANIKGAQWGKLAINCTITTIGALTGETLGDMLGDRRARQAFMSTYREVIDTALALGFRPEKIAVDPMLLYVPKSAGVLTRFLKDILVRIAARKHGKLKSSSLQSLERGRRTEIHFLNGYVVEQARKSGVRTPFNEALTRMIKEIEQGKRSLTPANMEELILTVLGR